MELEDAATNISNRIDFGGKEMTNILMHKIGNVFCVLERGFSTRKS